MNKKPNIKHKCDKCNFIEINHCPDSTWKCPKCGFSKRKIKHHCKKCGFKEYTQSPNWTCKCEKEFICDKCHRTFIFNGKNLYYFKNKKFHICEICSNELKGQGNIYKCSNCNNFVKAKNNFDICPICNNMLNKCNNGLKIIFCKKCNKETLHNGYVCSLCNPESVKKNNERDITHQCPICKEITINHSSAFMCKCGYKYNIPNGGLNRESFYADKFNIISFDDIDEEVTLDDFDSLRYELGVWARWTDENHGNYCLDVCKTVDIGGEMLSSIRSFNRLKNGTQEEKEYELSKKHGPKYQKQLNDCGDGKIIFKLVAYCDTEEEALAIEAQYAHDKKAKYWSPEPGQIKNLKIGENANVNSFK